MIQWKLCNHRRNHPVSTAWIMQQEKDGLNQEEDNTERFHKPFGASNGGKDINNNKHTHCKYKGACTGNIFSL